MVGIQADDLTGACDAGAPFAARGLETLVVLTDAAAASRATTADVVVLDTESRGLTVEDARGRACRAARALAGPAPRLLYKKLDSTLRGHVAAELDGMLDGTERPLAFLTPAFPAQGRAVVDGRLHIDGRPADQTAIARDPAFPPTGASVLGLLVGGGVCPVAALPLGTVRRGPRAVARRLGRFGETGGRVLAADAETDADLSTLAAAGIDGPALLAGSAGLAAALARRLGPGPTVALGDPGLRRPLLVVAGSAHPATRAQLDRLGRRDGLQIVAPAAPLPADGPARREVGARLAAAARARVEQAAPGTLVLTGGETAIVVLEALGAGGLRLRGELEPGLALAALVGGRYDGLAVVTKAGGFGDADALVRVWERSA
jgi:uncharacterized protein YgbK (DUF1537 family)